MLKNFLLYTESDVKQYKAHDITVLKVIGKKSKIIYFKTFRKKGFIIETHKNFWALTPKGYTFAQKLEKKTKSRFY